MEGYYICPFRVSLSTVREEIYKNKGPDTNYGQISCRGQFKLEPHPHWSPLGVNLHVPTSIPVTFIWEIPGVDGSAFS